MWRYDAQRSGASPHRLPANLELQWVREFPALKPAWPDQPKMQFDAAYEPIVLDRTVFIGSPREDCLIALDSVSGSEKWRFFADGPIRFAPVGWNGKVYFASDDGHLYCVDASVGKLVWKFRGAPVERRILGNERLISTWPARGAPVIDGDTVYFAASIWPFMGVFIHALDARTGEVRWTNDGDGSIYMKQPHNTDSFAGVAPQGPFAVAGNQLLIPGGRSVPACYDRQTGKMLRYQLAENGKRGGGHDVVVMGDVFFNGGGIFAISNEKYLGEIGAPVVVGEEAFFSVLKGALTAFARKSAQVVEEEDVDKKGKPITLTRFAKKELGSYKTPQVAGRALIQAGSRLYSGEGQDLIALDFHRDKGFSVAWKKTVDGTIARMIAADDRLFVVTFEGKIFCYGAGPPAVKEGPDPKRPVPAQVDAWTARARIILDTTNMRDGYCVAWGAGSGRLVTELAAQSNLHIIVVEPDAGKVHALRQQLTAAGLYGSRIAVHEGNAETFSLPPYFACLMVAEDLAGKGIALNAAFVSHAFHSLRPFGGVLCLPDNIRPGLLPVLVKEAKLVNAELKDVKGLTCLYRQGPLPDSANWTHEHADASNTRVSKDKLVKAPLGVLWFGGPSNDGILPRHGHGPQPQVCDGRLVIEGMDMLRCTDIYTGRILWETSLPGVGKFYNNLAHQPGANSSGTNYIATPEGVYVVLGSKCVCLDLATGKKIGEFKLPAIPGMKADTRWGYLNVSDDYVVGGADPLFDPRLDKVLPKGLGDDPDPDAPKKEVDKNDPLVKLLGEMRKSDNLSSSKHLVVFDRKTGKTLWTVSAKLGFRHNGTCIGGGRLYTIDRLSAPQLSEYKRRGDDPPHARLLAFDLQTGKLLWSTDKDVFGTWLSYSAKHDVLLEAGRVARDTLTDEPKGVRAYRADKGAVMWYDKNHIGPAMVHGDTVLLDQSGCDLLTGAVKMRNDPLTGQLTPWKWIRNYGCNTPAASEHLLTFRSGAAGYFDYCNDGGTGNFGGFRSSCTNNLIVAGGLLNAPDYTRTCTCLYQNQTSLALIHMPEAEMWTSFGTKEIKGPIQRVGILLGGPGDRKAEDGTLWLEAPSVGGVSPLLNVKVAPGNPQWFRRHSSQIEGKFNWVAASGAKGLSSVSLNLGRGPKGAKRTFTVRLHFMEPDRVQPGERVFHVALQGKQVLEKFDIVREAGAPLRSLVKEFTGVVVNDVLVVRLTASAGETVLCGIEVIAEGKE
jgi:outer membrane protein assembly factor BamB